MLKVIIVDDEFPSREVLKKILAEQGAEVIAEFEDGAEVVEFLRDEHDVDAVFLDIQMRDVDGMAAAWKIVQLKQAPYIVFTTGFSEYAVEAFELNAVDYVLKPFSKHRLEQTVCKLTELKLQTKLSKAKHNDYLAKDMPSSVPKMRVWSNDRMVILDPADILYITSDSKGGTIICSATKKFFTKMPLHYLEKQLTMGFARTHKSFLVNLSKVCEVVPWFNHTYMLTLEGLTDEKIPLARHYIKAFNIFFPEI